MAIGPGKYDDEVTELRERLKARGIVLLVRGGMRGDGFEVHLAREDLIKLPSILRDVADQVEKDCWLR